MVIKIINNTDSKELFKFIGKFPYMIGDIVTFNNSKSYLIKAMTKRNNILKIFVEYENTK